MAEKNRSPFNLGIDLEGPYFRSALWSLSLLTATSSYLTLKSTPIYNHYSLHIYDRPPVVLVTIFLLHAFLAVLSYFSPTGYLFDLRRRGNPLKFVADAVAFVIEIVELSVYLRNTDLMNNVPSMVLATTFALFLVCSTRVVAPGFGRRVPLIAVLVALWIAITIGRVWVLMPYVSVVLFANNFLHQSNHTPAVDS